MIPNKLRAAWDKGEPTLNGWLSLGNAFTAEIMAAQGFHSLTVDVQHGFLDYSDARGMLQGIRASGVVPMARASWLDAGLIMKLLDAGAYGIICPMVNNRDDAERFASYMRYPPRGTRSFGPIRANFSAGSDYAAHANDEVLAIAMIETAEAVENVEAICSTPGIDAVYIGPADLTLGVTNGRLKPGQDRQEPEMIEVIQRILAAAKNAGIRAGIHTGSVDYATKAVGWGFDMVTVGGDAIFVASGAGSVVRGFHEAMGSDVPDTTPSAY